MLSGNTTMFQSFGEQFTWKSALADFRHKQWFLDIETFTQRCQMHLRRRVMRLSRRRA